MKSLLFVPADDPRKLARAADADADACIFDLEDAVQPARKALARTLLVEHFRAVERCAGRQRWVRVNDPASPALLADLAAIVPLAPDGIVLPKLESPEVLLRVHHYLDMAEAAAGLPAGGIGIIAVCTETPGAVLRLAALTTQAWPRLRGLSWGAEDLSSALGATDPRTADGRWRPLYAHARQQCLLAAHALGVAAIDTVFVDFRALDALAAACAESRDDGFHGRLAIHPAQVPVINAAFQPPAEAIAQAERVVAAFAGGAGAVALDGRMLDLPHLKAARQLLARAGRAAGAPA